MPTSVCGRVTGRPATRISPAEGASRPAIMSSSVLLPQPDGPRTDRNSPSPTSSETPSSAWTGSPAAVEYVFDTPLARMSGGSATGRPRPRPGHGRHRAAGL